MKQLKTLEDVKNYSPEQERLFYSANHDEIASGATTDIYFIRTLEILKHLNLENTIVTAEIFARQSGMFSGIGEVINLLKDKNIEIWAIEEGDTFQPKETLVRIKGIYSEFGMFETVILGCLASSSGWATAARECREACGDKPFICFGSRHIHPAVAPVMERAAIIGGANNASNILAAKMMGKEPSGTVPHAAFLIAGDTLTIAQAYDECMPDEDPRIILIDTYKDEVEESLRVAEFLKDKLAGIRLDTPSERGGVTPALVQEVRARLDMAGYTHVKIFVSGGLTPERIRLLSNCGVDAFGVGSYISGAPAIEMTMDLKEVNGRPVAKRGRIPGLIANPKLVKIK
ncbi:MAG: Quinolinate phosphoribosyl transferase [Clostridia bacterium]|jgi:nicotinate phosphoribosyltransferase|uniref:nicotinate phosphoribosyltransferase n=1 Tax=Petroclostridium xylanilyticum TaxID=1792311 RepID=UPI000B98E1B7|nr:nicotinate phosphoribosyltransferase [Petroclostridium xylanilyticum]MBZ4646364.1 Quinolinate phosphoribosyl transferase [Clostridia bacterium]